MACSSILLIERADGLTDCQEIDRMDTLADMNRELDSRRLDMELIQRLISKNIDQHGVALQSFYFKDHDEIPAYTYTVGMTGIGLPELIVSAFL